jgi:hypothetical protein
MAPTGLAADAHHQVSGTGAGMLPEGGRQFLPADQARHTTSEYLLPDWRFHCNSAAASSDNSMRVIQVIL